MNVNPILTSGPSDRIYPIMEASGKVLKTSSLNSRINLLEWMDGPISYIQKSPINFLSLWRPNPLDDPHAMYCSTYVRYCYQEAGRDFLGNEINISNTTPEDIAQAGIKAGAIEIYRP